MPFKVPNQYRIRKGVFKSDESTGNYGAFDIPFESYTLHVIAAAGDMTGWEHVSVSLRNRIPNWREMCFIKSLFWDADDCVVQYHPAKSDYVNLHPNVLHLWRAVNQAFPMPPLILV